MARVVAVAMVAVLVVGLSGLWCHCVQALGTTNCVPDTVVGMYQEKLLPSFEYDSSDSFVGLRIYMMPLPGFDGVRMEVKSDNATFQAWFPILDHCNLKSSQWWLVVAYVRKKSATLNIGFSVHSCRLVCKHNIDEKIVTKIESLELFARGLSKWKQELDTSCGYQPIRPPHTENRPPPSCSKPPTISTRSTPAPDLNPTTSTTSSACVRQSNTITYATLGTAEVVVVAMIVAVVAKIMRYSRKQHEKKANTPQGQSAGVCWPPPPPLPPPPPPPQRLQESAV